MSRPDLPIGRPVGSSRFPASELVGVPKWARSWQEALQAVAQSGSGPGPNTDSSNPTTYSSISIPSEVLAKTKEVLWDKGSACRITTDLVLQTEQQLSERDRAILHTFQVVPLLTGNQFDRLHFKDMAPLSRERRRRDVLSRLVKLRVVERLARRVGGVRFGSSGYVFGLGLVGERILQDAARRIAGASTAPRRGRWRGGIALVGHTLGVSEVYVRAIEAQDAGLIEGVVFLGEPQCWQEIEPDSPVGEPWTLKPDALLSYHQSGGDGQLEQWFVEVDRGTHSPSTLQKKQDAYEAAWEAGLAIDGVMPRVWWVAVK